MIEADNLPVHCTKCRRSQADPYLEGLCPRCSFAKLSRKINDAMKRATSHVDAMPEWKRNILTHSSQPTLAVPRTPVPHGKTQHLGQTEHSMKICCLSDLHGHLPRVPDCDLLLLAGDYCPMSSPPRQRFWLKNTLQPWLATLAARMKIVAIAGNHDFIFQDAPEFVPSLLWTYLQDSWIKFHGLKIYGSPWQPRFHDWAFNLDEPDLATKWAAIPSDTDILLLHGPPHGYGDWSIHDRVHTGSPSLTSRILELKTPLVVAGHIHSGHGTYKIGESTTFINAAHVDERYIPAHEPIIFDFQLTPRPPHRLASQTADDRRSTAPRS